MSTTIEDKISLFAKVLFERIEEDYERERNNIVVHYEEEIKRITEEYENKKAEYINNAIKEAELKKQRIISKALTDKKQDVLKKKQELMEKLIADILRKVEEFLSRDEYGDFLLNTMLEIKSKFPENEKIIVNLSEEDFKNYSDYLRTRIDENIQLRISNEEIRGGIIAESGDGRIKIDLSVSSLLEEGKSLLAQLLFTKLGEGV